MSMVFGVDCGWRCKDGARHGVGGHNFNARLYSTEAVTAKGLSQTVIFDTPPGYMQTPKLPQRQSQIPEIIQSMLPFYRINSVG